MTEPTLKIDFRHANARDAKADIRRITFSTLLELGEWMRAHPSLGNGQRVDFDIEYEDEDDDTILVGSETEWGELLLQRAKGYAKKLRCYWRLMPTEGLKPTTGIIGADHDFGAPPLPVGVSAASSSPFDGPRA